VSGWWFELSATGHHRSGVDGTAVNRLAALVRFPYIAAMSRAPLGHEMALVTSKATEAAQRALRLIGIDKLLSCIVGLDSTTSHKPNPEPVLHALAQLRRNPVDAIFVGDSPHDIAAGNAAGVFTVAALWGPFTRQTLEAAHPSRLIDDIRDLPPLIEDLTTAIPAGPHP